MTENDAIFVLIRKMLIAALIGVFHFPALMAQEPKKAGMSHETLYSKGLKACLQKEIEEFPAFYETDLTKVVVLYDLDLKRQLPNRTGEIELEYFDELGLAQKFKALPKEKRKRGIRVQRIFPLSDKGNKLIFAYNTYWFTYSEKGGIFTGRNLEFNFGLEGGCHAEIAFDPTQDKFVIKEVKLWGV